MIRFYLVIEVGRLSSLSGIFGFCFFLFILLVGMLVSCRERYSCIYLFIFCI